MIYNIHPIFVHFPIAFLFIYSIIKIFPFKKWFPRIAWKNIETVLLVVGVIGALVADSTGETAEHIAKPDRSLVEMHSNFAGISTFLYGVLLAGEFLPFINLKIISKLKFPLLLKFFVFIEKLIKNNIFSIIISILGLITISVTGILGGVMVYGVSADPMSGIILNLLNIKY